MAFNIINVFWVNMACAERGRDVADDPGSHGCCSM